MQATKLATMERELVNFDSLKAYAVDMMRGEDDPTNPSMRQQPPSLFISYLFQDGPSEIGREFASVYATVQMNLEEVEVIWTKQVNQLLPPLRQMLIQKIIPDSDIIFVGSQVSVDPLLILYGTEDIS
jgi:hypothetical protein